MQCARRAKISLLSHKKNSTKPHKTGTMFLLLPRDKLGKQESCCMDAHPKNPKDLLRLLLNLYPVLHSLSFGYQSAIKPHRLLSKKRGLRNTTKPRPVCLVCPLSPYSSKDKQDSKSIDMQFPILPEGRPPPHLSSQGSRADPSLPFSFSLSCCCCYICLPHRVVLIAVRERE